jgi:acyl carrier protein
MDTFASQHLVQPWSPRPTDAEDPEAIALEALVVGSLAARLHRPMGQLSLLDRLERDLQVSPLTLVLLGLDLEDITGVRLPFEDLIRVITVGDLVVFLRECVIDAVAACF